MKHALFYILGLVLLAPGMLFAADGALFVEPENGIYDIGETFEMYVFADTDGELMTAAEAEILFDPKELEVESISKNGSVLASWPTEPKFSNEEGVIRFSGWAHTPYLGDRGLLIMVNFRALQASVSNAHLAAGAILAADGIGSNIVTSMKSGVYTIEARQITPEQADPADFPDEPVEETVATFVETPIFTDYPEELFVGERLIVAGETTLNTEVVLSLQRGDEPETKHSLLSNRDGEFTFVTDGGLESGVYRFWAFSKAQNGSESPVSETVRLTVYNDGFAAVAASGASLMYAILPFFILLLLAGLFTGYLFHRYKVEKLKHEIEELR